MVRDEWGKPVLDDAGHPMIESVRRDRPLVEPHHIFNVEQPEGFDLRPLQAVAPAWEGHERAEALMCASGVWIDHVAGDRACCRLSEDRVVLPERSQFALQDAYTHTALHELGHVTGHPSRLNRPTMVDHGGFGSESDTLSLDEPGCQMARRVPRHAQRGRVPLPGGKNQPGATPADGCDGGTPIGPENRRVSWGRSRHYPWRNTCAVASSGGRDWSSSIGFFGATTRLECDSGCDRRTSSQSHTPVRRNQAVRKV